MLKYFYCFHSVAQGSVREPYGKLRSCYRYRSSCISRPRPRLYSSVPELPASTFPRNAGCQNSFGMTVPDKRISG